MKIAIVDDNGEFSEKIQDVIEDFFEDKEEIQLSLFAGGTCLLNELEANRNYDIYFLDVVMPGIDGLELAKKIKLLEKDACIVFISSFDKYAIPSYKIRAFYYILKTEYREELPVVLEAIWQTWQREREDREAFYVIENENRRDCLKVKDILYLTKEKKYTVFHCVDGRIYRERNSLEAVCQSLPDDWFLFIDRGCIVNLKYVCEQEGTLIRLCSQNTVTELQMSRRMSREIKEQLIQYWGKKNVRI